MAGTFLLLGWVVALILISFGCGEYSWLQVMEAPLESPSAPDGSD